MVILIGSIGITFHAIVTIINFIISITFHAIQLVRCCGYYYVFIHCPSLSRKDDLVFVDFK